MISYKTAEAVSPKHPDKLCDQISDAILDAYLMDDPNARCAVETVGGHGRLFITGEVTSSSHPNLEQTIRKIVGQKINIEINLVKQSSEIARGVDTGGAGDQGIMVGYASSETPQHLPTEVILSRFLNQNLYENWPYDGKTQVTLKNGKISSIVASFQNATKTDLEDQVTTWLNRQDKELFGEKIGLHINPAGDWSQGGFDADTGLTGRKLVVDNYGPRIPIGGGCFSGKDPSKVDRSAAYMARKIALDYLKKYHAKEVFCHLAYAIGYNQPLQATVTVDGRQRTVKGYDLSPSGIIEALDLKRPIYEPTAHWGHFGHSKFSWEA